MVLLPPAMLLAVAAAPCPVEEARYALKTAPGVTADFRDVDSGREWPSGLALRIRFRSTGHSYWWLPWNGGTDGRQQVASTTDATAPGWRPPSPDGGPRPLGDLEYPGVDAGWNVLQAVSKRSDAAPAHFLLPDLGPAVWRRGEGGGDRAPKEFFDLAGCGPAPRSP